MAWREKMAWLTLGAMLCAYSLYFTLVASSEWSKWGMLLLFGVITSIQAIFVIAASIVMAVFSHKDARKPADERDKSIARRGANVAYYVLMAGMIVVGVVMPFKSQGWQLTNAALLALVLAEAVRQTIIIASYRRGWHG